MPIKPWRPVSEAEAASTPAVFIEWLRAVHGVAPGGPAELAAWRHAEPAAFAAAISEFANLPLPLWEGAGGRGGDHTDPDTRLPLPQPPPAGGGGFLGVREILLGGQDDRLALVTDDACTWSRAEVLDANPLPEPIEQMLKRLSLTDLPALAASHLLDAGTYPDTRLHWTGDPDNPWPLGAWLVGGAVILGR